MIIFSTLMGFLLVLLIDKWSKYPTKAWIKDAWHSVPMLFLYVVMAAIIVVCSFVYYAGGARTVWGWPYRIGEFLAMPIVGMSIIAFIIGSWAAVGRVEVLAFLEGLIVTPAVPPGEANPRDQH